MKFFSGGPDDLKRLLEGLAEQMGAGGGREKCDGEGGVDCPCGKTHKAIRRVKMDEEDIKRYKSLCSRSDALNNGYRRAMSKMESDANRNWADLKDKYGLHGISSLHINDETFEIEVLE